MSRELRSLFQPASVAVVGASNDPVKWGYGLARGALRGERRRAVYLVNRAGGEILGRPAYRSLDEVPRPVELVVVAVPEAGFERTVDEALAAGARAIVGITAGLGESGPGGRAREHAVVERVREAGAVLLGPTASASTTRTPSWTSAGAPCRPVGSRSCHRAATWRSSWACSSSASGSAFHASHPWETRPTSRRPTSFGRSPTTRARPRSACTSRTSGTVVRSRTPATTPPKRESRASAWRRAGAPPASAPPARTPAPARAGSPRSRRHAGQPGSSLCARRLSSSTPRRRRSRRRYRAVAASRSSATAADTASSRPILPSQPAWRFRPSTSLWPNRNDG